MEQERTHIYPMNDTRDHHTSGVGCWCQPVIDAHLVIHNAADAREFFEGDSEGPKEAIKRLLESGQGISLRTMTE
jgi:hypothetical protein